MRIQTDTTDSTATMTSTAGTAAKTTASTTDFQAIYNSKVQELWEDFAETGLTAADQALKKAGGEEERDARKNLPLFHGVLLPTAWTEATIRGRAAGRRDSSGPSRSVPARTSGSSTG